MGSVSMSGADTIILNERLVTDLADGDVVDLSFPDEIANVTKGKNGNAIYSFNETGGVCECVIRVLRGSADDKYYNNLLTQMVSGFSSFVLLTGEFIKKIGDGKGKVTSDTYVLSGGIFTKRVAAKSNVAGETEQSIAIYTLRFANAPRSIG